MGLFESKGRKHLNGYKDLSKHNLKSLECKSGDLVYFPTLAPNSKPITYIVKEGDTVLKGQRIGLREDFYVPVYASVSGVVMPKTNIFSAQHGRPIPHIVIASDGKETETTDLLKIVSPEDDQTAIFEAIKESGIVGMGGAGFPTYFKYQNAQGIHTILINGVECEPFLTTDFVVSYNGANDIILGVRYLMKAAGAQRAIIALKVHKEEARDALKAAAEAYPEIEVREVPDVYPMGWEKVLIKEVFKKTYEKFPSDIGVIVNNLQTACEVGRVLSSGKPVTERIVTVSGNAVKEPANVKCKIGSLASSLIELCGGYTEEEVSLIPGGPMCSKSVSNEKFPIILQMGAITILKYIKLREDTCLRCGECSKYCPANLQPVEIARCIPSKDLDRMVKLNVNSCVECGMCSYVCPSHIDVTKKINTAKTLLRALKKN